MGLPMVSYLDLAARLGRALNLFPLNLFATRSPSSFLQLHPSSPGELYRHEKRKGPTSLHLHLH